MLTKHILISGRVQGVGFRAFVQRIAENHNICGWVRNLDDGRVEILVQMAADQWSDFQQELQKGPPRGRVDTMEIVDIVPKETFKIFNREKDGSHPWSK